MHDAPLRHFCSFLREEGVHFNHDIARFGQSSLHGHGVFAQKRVSSGTLIAHIPTSALLSVRSATLFQPSSTSDECERDRLCERQFALPAALLFETMLGERSRWARYIAMLPQTLEHIGAPLALDDDTLRELFGGTGVDVVTIGMRSMLREGFEELVKPILKRRVQEMRLGKDVMVGVDWERFVWAYAVVRSRAFDVGGGLGNCLVVVADMFNHCGGGMEHIHVEVMHDDEQDSSDDESAEQREQNEEDEEYEGLKIVCVRDVEKDAEMFNTFGHKSCTTLYLNYGFVERHGAHSGALIARVAAEHALRKRNDKEDAPLQALRQRAVELADDIIADDEQHHHFELTEEEPFPHGLLVLVLLHTMCGARLREMDEDEMSFLQRLMDVGVEDVVDGDGGGDVARDVLEQIVGEKMAALREGGRRGADDAKAGVVRVAAQLRQSQLRALDAASAALRAIRPNKRARVS